MAANLNKVFLMGNLTRDPELKYTPQGTAVAKFAIAVNRQFKGGDGDLKKEVNFFNIVVWGKSGENCSKFLSKGRAVFVEGRLHNNIWEKDGQKRTTTEIIADSVQFIGGAGGPGGAGRGPDEGGEMAPDYGGGDADYPAPGGGDDGAPF